MFPAAIQDGAALDAMIAFASRHLAYRVGRTSNEERTYRLKSIRQLRSDIESSKRRTPSDCTLLAVAGLAASFLESPYEVGFTRMLRSYRVRHKNWLVNVHG